MLINKQNHNPNLQSNISPRSGNSCRKYSYTDCIMSPPSTSYIKKLQQQLAIQKQKVKQMQQHTVRQQIKVLQQIDILEIRFVEVQNQKQQMRQLLQASMRQIEEYKKVKGIANALVGVVDKVEGPCQDLHQAWRKVKNIIWEHQNIKNKAMEWKKVYDEAKKDKNGKSRNKNKNKNKNKKMVLNSDTFSSNQSEDEDSYEQN